MIGALPPEYAQARMQARYGQRGDEPLWNQLRGARSLVAALEILRASPLRRWVAAISVDADADEIELRLRAAVRACIDEVAGWGPEDWQPATAWTAHLVDLPAVARLAGGEFPAPWMRRDPALQQYAESDPEARRAALRKGPLSPVVAAIESRLAEDPGQRSTSTAAAALEAWRDEWRDRWPDREGADAGALDELIRLVMRHLARFLEVGSEEAWTMRRELEAQIAVRFRRHALTPVAAFAYLALVALDIEKLRAQLVVRAAFGAVP
ncbi:MAG TPA: hypothetical protein VLC47_05790 [Burkholderiales bacterium]|nr:hypothetical protein [Burkholderiales bacterium]